MERFTITWCQLGSEGFEPEHSSLSLELWSMLRLLTSAGMRFTTSGELTSGYLLSSGINTCSGCSIALSAVAIQSGD